MTILVTGGAGYIGSHMVHALVDAGERVVVLDNLSTGFDWAVAKQATLVIGETGDQALVQNLIAQNGVEAIIHFAASIVVPESVADPLGYYRNNTANSRALIECAVRGGVKQFIFSSTAAVYGNPAKVPVDENDQLMPMSPYGSSKLMTEIMLRDAGAAHGLAHVILRYFNLGRRPRMQVFGTDYPTPDGTCVRDYIHVADLVRAHGDALRYLRGGGASTTLNCGYGRGFSVFQVIDTVRRVSGVDFEIELAARRPGDPARIVARSDKIRALLGWRPQYDDLATIARDALEWELRLATLPGRKAAAAIAAA